MAFEPALAVDGALIPMSQLRRLLYQATNGNRGITLPTDMKVTALTVPGGAVNIARGSGAAPSPWRPSESYGVANANADSMDIVATGSSGQRIEYLVAKIRDHHYDSGQVPDDPENDSYTEFVAVSSLANLNYPYIPLAKLTIPANTQAITNSMITDIRKVANPREKTAVRANELVIADTETLTHTRDDGEFWPNAGGVQQADIPTWATRVIIEATWHSVTMPAENAWGRLWVGWGTLATPTRRENNTQEVAYNSVGAGTTYSTNLSLCADRYIPAAYRGREQVQFNAFGRKISGPGPQMTSLSSFSMRLTFLEVADLSDS